MFLSSTQNDFLINSEQTVIQVAQNLITTFLPKQEYLLDSRTKNRNLKQNYLTRMQKKTELY